MKFAKWLIGIILIIAFVGVYINNKNNTTETASNREPYQNNIKKSYNNDGSLKADAEISNGVNHGVAHNYYSDGSIHSTMHYKFGKKHGLSTWFYPDGLIYRTTPFENGVKHGVQKKYYKNGKLIAEIPFSNNKLQPGTVEYNKAGNKIENIFHYKYEVLSKPEHYQGKIIQVKGKKIQTITKYKAFINSNKPIEELDSERTDESILFYVPTNAHNTNTKVTIWLYTKTKLNNKYIVEKTISCN